MDIKTKDELKLQLADSINRLTEARNTLIWVLDNLDKEE